MMAIFNKKNMKFINQTVCLILFLILLTFNLDAQLDSKVVQQFKTTLAQKKISEAEVKKRMETRGFNTNDVKPEEYPLYQKALEEVIAEIEAERTAGTGVDQGKPVSNEQELSVEADKSKEEAISEIVTREIQKEIIETGIYGHDVFKNSEISLYRSADDINAPETYILSSGDEILVSIFGDSQVDLQYKINDQGYIFITNLGRVNLKGMSIREARKILYRRLKQRYTFKSDEFSIVLKTARTLTINFLGEVQQVGSFKISAINNGFNALVAAGGPKASGSVRNIRLIKGNGTQKNLDVYKYLLNPKVQYDFFIEDQDIIHIPFSESIVTIEGAVKRPMKYEMKKGESLEDLIKYSGGLRSDAFRKVIQVSRQTDEGRIIKDVSFNRANSFELQNGDIITVKQLTDDLKSFVKASGEVQYPDQYNFRDGMTLQNLIDNAKLKPYTRLDFVYLFREQANGKVQMKKLDLTSLNAKVYELKNKDEVLFFSLRSFQDESKSISIEGAVRNPKTLVLDGNSELRVSDLILISGGLKTNANPIAQLTRIDSTNSTKRNYINVDLNRVENQPNSVHNLVLQEGDVLLVYENERYTQAKNVSIIGEVRNPGSLVYNTNITLEQLLLNAGGLKENANIYGVVKSIAQDNSKEVKYRRFNIQDVLDGKESLELLPDDVVQIYDNDTYMESYSVSILGEVKKPGSFVYDPSLKLQDLLFMSGGITQRAAKNKVDIYRIVFEKNDAIKKLIKTVTLNVEQSENINAKENISLQPYDVIVVRPIPNFRLQEVVSIRGEVKYPGPYLLSDNLSRLKDLVRESGGFTSYAFPLGATLKRKRTNKKGFIFIDLKDAMTIGGKHENIRLLPGDEIFVPKNEGIVSIRTFGTRANKEYQDSLLVFNAVQIAYQGKRSAKWYINEFAGGLDDEIDYRTIRVIGPGGRINSTRRYMGFIYDYPLVTPGSTIAVDYKEKKVEKEEKRESIDWGKTITDVMAIIGSSATIYGTVVALLERKK